MNYLIIYFVILIVINSALSKFQESTESVEYQESDESNELNESNKCGIDMMCILCQLIYGDIINSTPPCITPEPSTCPPPPPTPRFGDLLPCGSVLQYNIADPAIVVENGFSAGLYSDGSQAYVGVGNNNRCNNEFNCPGRISVDGSKPGIDMSCTSTAHDTVTTRFVVAHPNMKWVKATSPFNTTNLVTIQSANYQFYFGRVNITKSDGNTYTIVSKVFEDGDMLHSEFGPTTRTKDIDVLSC